MIFLQSYVIIPGGHLVKRRVGSGSTFNFLKENTVLGLGLGLGLGKYETEN